MVEARARGRPLFLGALCEQTGCVRVCVQYYMGWFVCGAWVVALVPLSVFWMYVSLTCALCVPAANSVEAASCGLQGSAAVLAAFPGSARTGLRSCLDVAAAAIAAVLHWPVQRLHDNPSCRTQCWVTQCRVIPSGPEEGPLHVSVSVRSVGQAYGSFSLAQQPHRNMTGLLHGWARVMSSSLCGLTAAVWQRTAC